MQAFPNEYASRQINPRGEEARQFLSLTGWALESPEFGFSYAGDLVKNKEFVVSRFWHSAARFAHTPEARERIGSRFMLLAVTEGELIVRTDASTSIVPAGSILVARPESLTLVENVMPVACSLFMFKGQELEEDVLVGVGVAAPDYLSLLLSLTNSLLSRPIPPADSAFVLVERAVIELVTALAVVSKLRFQRAGRRPGNQIYLDAITLIAACASNPSTTVETIARELGVSRSHLFRAFKPSGSSPSTYLRRIRARRASRLLETGTDEQAAAELSGFGTSRRMRRALADA